MTCAACTTAATRPDSPLFHAACKGCAVRALAQGPQYHASGVDGALSKSYRTALAQIFGDDWREGHVLVKAEADRIKKARAHA